MERIAMWGRDGLVALVLGGCLAAAAGAQTTASEPWAEAFAGNPQAVLAAAQALPAPPGDLSVDTLLMEASYRFEADGRATIRRRHVYRLLSADAVDEDEGLTQSWSPWHQERPRLRARVITPDGAEHQLDESTIAETGTAKEALIFDDDRVLSAPLPALTVGAVVEIETVVVETAPFFSRGTVHTEGIWAEHVRRFRVEVEAPDRLPFRFVMRLLPADAARESYRGGRRQWVYELRDWKPEYRFLEGRPAEEPAFPYVAFTTGSSWRAVAEAYSEIVDQVIESADVGAAVAAASKGAKSEHERIERLVRHVQSQVRYTGIEFGAAKIVPYSPAVVLARRYGDCKDKAALLVAMLRKAGIPAYLALLQTNEYRETELDLPGLGLFNHAIVHIPGSPGIWIDATVEQARAGQLPIGEQGRWALIASSTTSGLVRIPEDPSTTNLVRVERELRLSPLGPGRVVERAHFEGWPELELRSWLATAKESTRKSSLEAYTENALLSKEIERFAFTAVDDFARPFERTIEVKGVGRLVTELGQALVAMRYDSLLGRVPDSWQQVEEEAEEPEEGEEPEPPRTVDFVLDEPHVVELHNRILPPAGFRVRQLPEARSETLGTLKLETSYREEADGTVDVLWRLDSGKRRLSPAELTETRQKLSSFLAYEEVVLLYFDQVAFAEVLQGDAREGLLELRRQAEAAPKDALARVRLASASLTLGLVEPAREFAAEAVRLGPELAAAHEAVGLASMYGFYGQVQGEGWDRDAAVAAYREATRLNGEVESAWVNLGVALEHNARGFKHGVGWDPEGAAQAFGEVLKLNEESGARSNRALALGHLGRWQEAADVWPRTSEEMTAKLYRLVAAYHSGGVEAVQRLARREPDPQARGRQIAGAAGLLYVFRLYDAARALLALPEVGRVSGPTAQTLEAQKRVLAKVKRYEDVPPAPPGPAGVPLAVVRWLANGGTEEEGRALLSRHATYDPLATSAAAARSLREQIEDGFRTTPAGASTGFKGAADVWVSVLEIELDGDESYGYRAKVRAGVEGVQAQGDGGLVSVEVFLVREAGTWRWLDTAPAGLPVLAHLQELRRAEDWRGLGGWLALINDQLDEPDAYQDPWQLRPRTVLRVSGPDADPREIELAHAAFVLPVLQQFARAGRLAAADRGFVERLLPKLEAAVKDAPEPRRSVLDQLLWSAFETLGRRSDGLAVLEEAFVRHPGSVALRFQLFDQLSEVGPRERAEAWLAEREKADPKAKELPEMRCELEAKQGELALAARCYEQRSQVREAPSMAFNQAAWFYLVAGLDAGKAAELASQGAARDKAPRYALLHTKAYAEAVANRPRDAAATLAQALKTKVGAPDANEALVLGQIAESCGLLEAAKRWYQRAVEGGTELSVPSSAEALAQRSLERLAGAKGKKR